MTCIYNSTQALPSLVFLTDAARYQDTLSIIENLPPRTGVVLRDYSLKNRKKLALDIAKISRDRNLVFLVGADSLLAREVAADGLHIPEWNLKWRLTRKSARFYFKRDWLITASVHNLEAIRYAEKLGVDAVIISPVFYTNSHPDKRGLGIHRFYKLANKTSLPFYPLGGLSETNFKRLPKLKNMAGIAGISFFTENN